MTTKPQDLRPDTAGYYDALADGYDELAQEADWPAKADNLIQRAFEATDPDTVETVLDLGAGTGHSVDAIRRNATNPSRIVAVDISSKMLGILRARHKSPIVETVNSSTEDYLAGCQSSFDMVTAMGTLEFVPGLPQVLGRHLGRLLNQGGVFAATYLPLTGDEEPEKVFEWPDKGQAMTEYRWPAQDIEQSLDSQGLTVVEKVDSLAAYELEGETVHCNFLVAQKP